MIFLSGVHAVGKGYFCDLVSKELGIDSYTASTLITKASNSKFGSDKLVDNIGDNQQYLLGAVDELRDSGSEFILDGHFCLTNKSGKPERIAIDTFKSLKPEAIILLTEKPEIISERRKQRDNVIQPPQEIEKFQEMEKQYAEEVAELLNAKLFVSSGESDLPDALVFLNSL